MLPGALRSSLRTFFTASTPPRVAVVTGAAGGIGNAIAARLARDGFSLIVADLPAAKESLMSFGKEMEALYGEHKVRIHCGDVTQEEDVKDLVNEATQEFGGLDVVSVWWTSKMKSAAG